MKRALGIKVILAPSVSPASWASRFGGRAMAISTLEDTLRDPPRIFRTPSSEPPNNAVHRDFGGA